MIFRVNLPPPLVLKLAAIFISASVAKLSCTKFISGALNGVFSLYSCVKILSSIIVFKPFSSIWDLLFFNELFKKDCEIFRFLEQI